ncbi:hypothetical protein A2872_03510 [Candidatus Gottesmanbacteria bacterium RIFCSPHIGHO2_01_FULL_42_12]|uniref:Uncharacterized protein n=1 Tax=Candidatus Gottesmanbacteria bacterium RIFCSPHIGHO2_01_FULL_42_12 TaxID=1798377 RepID=A0A1F5Z4R7_9BACT|nr:MAG: hypothetical protein A2872_03510 [Candidatus Gottesmanbacteria bacterium RIFCSPHIGHO2_01_FULL_42_12]
MGVEFQIVKYGRDQNANRIINGDLPDTEALTTLDDPKGHIWWGGDHGEGKVQVAIKGFPSIDGLLTPGERWTMTVPMVLAGHILHKLKAYDISLTWNPRE